MDILCTASEKIILESSLKCQSDMQSCKLNDSESKPNITLKKIGQELDVAETKCLTLRTELNNMMNVCRKGQMEVKGSKGTFDVPHEQILPLPKSRDSKCSVEYRNYTSVLSPKSGRFSPRGNFNNADVAKCEVSKEETQKGLFNVTITPRTQLDKTLPPAITTMPIQNKTVKPNMDKEYKNLSSYPEHVREYLQSMLNVKDSVKELISTTDEDCVCITPSCVRENSREPEFYLDRLKDTRARQAAKYKYAPETPRNEVNSICKTSDITSKIRKRKGKLRSSVSRSTVMTKDTYPLGKKEAKRRRNKGHGVTRQQSTLLKHTKKSNDVVEIFHNTTLKSSNSKVSAKYSKLVRGAKYTKKQNLAETANQKMRKNPEYVTREHQFRNKENQQRLETLNRKNNPKITTANNIQEQDKSGKHFNDLCLETLNHKSPRATVDNIQEQNKSGEHFNDLSLATLSRESNPRVTTDNVQKQHKLEKHLNDSPTRCKIAHQREHTVCSKLNNPMSTPNYEMPTLASKLKHSNRSYFGRFNFRNIPFVVSTSVTPSHNLGLNIQQVLSVMKTRQPVMKDVAPLLTHKVSRSMKPVSTFLEQINVQYNRSIFNLMSQTTGQLNDKENLNIKEGRRLSAFELQHVGQARSVHMAESSIAKTIPESDNGSERFCKEKGDFHEEYKVKRQSSFLVANRSSTSAYSRNQQRITRMTLSKEDDIGDHKTHIADSYNSKEIRDVLINLHDQFEEMNTRYEKLQSEMEKSDDATPSKELSTLEKELHVKEEEINAVISLYKEVMSLKQQMKILRKKSSLICVATESSIEPHRKPFSVSFIPGRSHLANTAEILGRRRESNIYGATRDPPVSVQLVALLRQIQTFHKQLQLVS